jgi:acylaminoacyl-peptidase
VNYRGSTGYGRVPLESLVGKVGSQDVHDCHAGLRHVLEQYTLSMHHVHVSGGSHGGWLGSHLVCQYPRFYRSAVLRNPVVNLVSQFYTSDIPDWGCAVAGIASFDAISFEVKSHVEATRAAIVARLWEMSPMAHDLSRVVTPVLFGIGAKDVRVPPSEGLQLYTALQHHGCPSKVLWYPEDSHPLDSVKTYADFMVHWALWLHAYNHDDSHEIAAVVT